MVDEQASRSGGPRGSGERAAAEAVEAAAATPVAPVSGMPTAAGSRTVTIPDSCEILSGLLQHLRPSLVTTLGFADLLRDPGLDDAGRQALLDRLTTAGRRAGRMLEMVAELRRLTDSEPPGRDERLELLADLDRLLLERRGCIEARELEVGIRSHASMPIVFAVEAARVRLAIAAGLDDAVAAVADGRLEIRLGFVAADSVTPAASDGLSREGRLDDAAELRGRLWIEFLASGRTSSDPVAATETTWPVAETPDASGLGIRVARAAIEAIGGCLRVARSERHGCRIRLDVPASPLGDRLVIEQGMPASRPVAGGPAVGTPLRGLRVIVAEGQPEPRWLLRAVLERSGAVVEEVVDGPGLLETLARDAKGVLLLSLELPGCDPRQLILGLRREGMRLPVITMATADPGRLGDAWLATPVDPASLVEACALWRGRRHGSPPGAID